MGRARRAERLSRLAYRADGATGCRVITEECQNGIVPKLAWWYLRPMLERGHQNWIESLKRVAEGGDPS
jgi:hypothetical protein